MTTIEIPIRATTVEAIPADASEVGRILADAGSTTQAEFFLAFWENVTDAQLLYIGDDATFGPHRESTRAEVADVYRALADAIEKGGRK